jgi:K+-sensing histidine kinase KdpD
MSTNSVTRRFALFFDHFEVYLLVIAAVAVLTGIFLLVGRNVLGEGVIALLYLVPISWSTARWGQGPGITAAVSAALAFNFFFIPPFYTLYIGSVEGWFLLFIFLGVAIVVVGRIQVGLAQAKAREREAIFMYELSAALAGALTPQAVARILAAQTQQLFQAALAEVVIDWDEGTFNITAPAQRTAESKPDLIIPILATRRLEGEIRLWQGAIRLPSLDDRLIQNYAKQGALALERARLVQVQAQPEAV